MEQKTIDPLIRKRIFGLYAGQKIMTSDSFNDGADHFEEPILSLAKYSGVFLAVTPLWRITKEDAVNAIEKAYPKIQYRYPHNSKIVAIASDEMVVTMDDIGVVQLSLNSETGILTRVNGLSSAYPQYLDYFDFLRSKGYALPAFGFSVKELYEQKVFWWPDEDKGMERKNKGIQNNALAEQI